MALTTVYTDLELPPGPRGIPQLPKPPGPVAGHRWYWVIMGTGWVGAAVLAGIVVWLLQRHVSDGNSLNPTGSCSWESCLGKDTPSSNCSLNYFQLGLRERLCEAESHQAPGLHWGHDQRNTRELDGAQHHPDSGRGVDVDGWIPFAG
eukprot:XP_027326167.1 uncharacterized protein LOC101800394 isoform X3 [Anas platyrhynchos]